LTYRPNTPYKGGLHLITFINKKWDSEFVTSDLLNSAPGASNLAARVATDKL